MRKLVVHLILRILYIVAMGPPVSPHTTQKQGQVPVLNRADILVLLQSVPNHHHLNQSISNDNEPIQNQSRQQIHFDTYTTINHNQQSKTSTLLFSSEHKHTRRYLNIQSSYRNHHSPILFYMTTQTELNLRFVKVNAVYFHLLCAPFFTTVRVAGQM